MPTARMPLIEICFKMLVILGTVRNAGWERAMIVHNKIKAQKIPVCRKKLRGINFCANLERLSGASFMSNMFSFPIREVWHSGRWAMVVFLTVRGELHDRFL